MAAMHHHEFFNVVRSFVLLSVGMLALEAPTAHAGAPQVKTEAPAYFRLMLGDYEITVLWDGTAARQMDRIMSRPALVREVYERDHEPLPTAMSINTFLI